MAHAEINGTNLFFVEVGDGLPVLVMHGGLGLDHTYLHPWLDPLGDVLRLVYYDHRGNGRSGRPPLDTLTHEQMINDADALREHLGFEKVAVLGSSHGGFVALRYVLSYPQSISHLILLGSAPRFDSRERVFANARRRGATPEIMRALEAAPESDDAWIAQKFKTIAPLYFHRPDAYLVERAFGRTVWSGSAGVRGRELTRDYNVEPRLGEIQTPTLILVGRDDFIAPPEHAERLHQGIVGSQLVVFERSGHFPYLEEPDTFFQTVRDWLRATSSNSSAGA